MSKRMCKHCGLPWRVAVMRPCSVADQHEFIEKAEEATR